MGRTSSPSAWTLALRERVTVLNLARITEIKPPMFRRAVAIAIDE
jgi:hypothetical protein